MTQLRGGESPPRNLKKTEGKEIGEERVNELTLKLSKMGRIEDIIKAASDRSYQERLFKEFGL